MENSFLKQEEFIKRCEMCIYIDAVLELNQELYDRFGETEFNFEYSANGYYHAITFNGIMLWNSEEDEREFIEIDNNYEPLVPYIKKVFNNMASKIYSLKM